MLTISYTYSQEKTIISDLEDLSLNIGEVFKPNSKVVNSDGSEAECDMLYYYNKKGVFSSAKSITFDRSEGTLIANEPGTHEVVAICIDSEGKRLSKTFYVNVNYPKIKEVKVSVDYSWFFFIYLTLKIDDFNIYLYKKTKITIYDNNNIVFEKSI